MIQLQTGQARESPPQGRAGMDELRFPPLMSLCIILSANFLFNLSFFIIVPTATSYTKHLGGESLFSGLTVGVVTLVSFILVIPLSKLPKFKRKYSPTLDLSSACLILGHIIADRTGVLYLVLLGRMINGIGLTGCFFLKRYCTDPCIVGVRRRTTCTSLLILAQPLGMVPGPIVGGFLARIPMKTALFNKNTLPGWFMAVVWSIYWLLTKVLFKDVTDTADQLHEHHDSRLEVRDSKYDARSQCAEGEGAREASQLQQQLEVPRFARWFLSFQRHHGQVRGISRDSRYDTQCECAEGEASQQHRGQVSSSPGEASQLQQQPDDHQVSIQMSHLECNRAVVSPLFVSCLMSYTAFVIFFELGSWETSIPIYSWKKFGYDAFEAGNFIGLIGLGTVFLVATMPALAHKIQDRLWLAAGCFLGLAGIVANYILLGGNSGHMNFPSYAAQWFVVCLGFNTASSITLSLLSKNLGNKSSDRAAIAVQLSNYSGRLLGAIWGTAADMVGDRGVALGQLLVATVAMVGIIAMWRFLRAQRG